MDQSKLILEYFLKNVILEKLSTHRKYNVIFLASDPITGLLHLGTLEFLFVMKVITQADYHGKINPNISFLMMTRKGFCINRIITFKNVPLSLLLMILTSDR